MALILKDYQETAMRLLWNTDDGMSSREVWQHVNEQLKKAGGRPNGKRPDISRASIINFCNAMVDEGVLGYREITGKGGHRRIYYPEKSEQEFWVWVIQVTDKKLRAAAG